MDTLRVVYPLELPPPPAPTHHESSTIKAPGILQTSRVVALFGLLSVNLNNDPGTYWPGILRRKPCHRRYFTTVFAFFSVTVAVSSHLCVFVNVIVSRLCRLSEFYPGRASQLEIKPRDSLEVKPYGNTWKWGIKKLPEIAQLIPFKLRCRNIFSFF